MHARVADPRCPIASSFIGACDTSPENSTTYTTARCTVCLIVSHKTLLLSVGFGQQTAAQSSSAEGVLTTADYP